MSFKNGNFDALKRYKSTEVDLSNAFYVHWQYMTDFLLHTHSVLVLISQIPNSPSLSLTI